MTRLAAAEDGLHLYSLSLGGVRGGARIDHLVYDAPTDRYQLTGAYVPLRDPVDIDYAPVTDEVIVLSRLDTRVERFSRDPSSGELTLIDRFVLATQGVDDQAYLRVTYSPDGRNAYLWGGSDYSIVALDLRTTATRYAGTAATEEPFNSSNGLVVSGDGAHLYAGGRALEIFARDSTDGALTRIGDYANDEDPPGDLTSLSDIVAMTTTADGAFLHVLAAASTSVAERASIVVLARDAASGALSFVDAQAVNDSRTAPEAHNMGLSSDEQALYVSDYVEDFYASGLVRRESQILRLPVDAAGTLGAPVRLSSRHRHGRGMWAVPILGNDQALGYDRRSISRFGYDPATNALSEEQLIRMDERELESIAGVDELEYVAAADALIVRSRLFDSTSDFVSSVRLQGGSLVPADSESLLGEWRDVTSTAASPDGRHVYAVASLGGLWRLDLDPTSAALGDLDADRLLFDFDGFAPEQVLISSDGRYLYVTVQVIDSGQFNESTAGILTFRRNATTGAIELIDNIDSLATSGGNAKRGILRLTISHDGRFAYLLNRFSEEIQIYARDTGTGLLTFQGSVSDFTQSVGQQQLSGLWEAADAAISPDDRYLYVAADEIYVAVNSRGFSTNIVSLMVFERDRDDGSLRLIQQLERDGQDAAGNPIDVGGGARSLSMAPDGTKLLLVMQGVRNTSEHVRQSGRRIDVFRIQSDGQVVLATEISTGAAGRGLRDAVFDREGRIVAGNMTDGVIEVFEAQ